MERKPINLWLLNRVVAWDHERLVDALSAKYQVKLGRRVRAGAASGGEGLVELAVNAGEQGAPGELMHEGADPSCPKPTGYDEYFMPIPSKCLGSEQHGEFWRRVARPGSAAFADAWAAQAKRFPASGSVDLTAARRATGPHFGDVRMNLADPRAGYYQLLQQATQANGGAKNVLVGYSQGGTVARYLAFLDEEVARPELRCIHGVITVQSPNRGSPVASPPKKAAVSSALLGVLLSLPRWLPDPAAPSPVWTYLGAAGAEHSLIDFVNGLLDALLHTWKGSQQKAHLFERLRTARKWLSGLSGVPDTAFYDLDPLRIGAQGSVLDSIQRYPLGAVLHGAVIGTDNRSCELVQALLASANWYVRLAAWLWRGSIRRLVAQADAIYKDAAMSFPDGADATLLRDYQAGLPRGAEQLDRPLEARAHDFVIPSVSQLLIPAGPAHLGNLVNPDASHITGAQLWEDREGKTDEDLVAQLLAKM
jgi:hypothetical protein